MLCCDRRWETSQDRGKDRCRKMEQSSGKILFQSALDLRLEQVYISTGQRPKAYSQETKVMASGKLCESPDLNPIKHLWKDLKMAVHQHFPFNQVEPEWFCQEEWQKIPKERWATLVGSIPKKTQGCCCCQRCCNQVSERSEYLCKWHTVSQF